MIQRIQTLYLAVVFIIGIALQFVSFGIAGNVSFTAQAIVFDNEIVSRPIGVSVLAGISAVLALITLFKYKNRKLQLTLCKLNIVVLALLLAAIFFYFDNALSKLELDIEADYGIGTILPIISIILCFMADRAITKDDKLIRSVDRIR